MPDQTPQPLGSATDAPTLPKPKEPPPKSMPPWKLLLHNDDVNDRQHVVQSLVTLTSLSKQDATLRMMEAEEQGVALVLTTHQEKAELYQQQLRSCGLTVTIEPGE